MGGATPKGFPYPTGDDRVSDGDNAMEALARAVDAYIDGTAWVTPALGAGWTGALHYRKDGAGNVTIVGLTGATAGNTNALFNLPAGFRPPYAWPITTFDLNVPAGQIRTGLVSLAGDVTMSSLVDISVYIGVVFPTRATP